MGSTLLGPRVADRCPAAATACTRLQSPCTRPSAVARGRRRPERPSWRPNARRSGTAPLCVRTERPRAPACSLDCRPCPTVHRRAAAARWRAQLPGRRPSGVRSGLARRTRSRLPPAPAAGLPPRRGCSVPPTEAAGTPVAATRRKKESKAPPDTAHQPTTRPVATATRPGHPPRAPQRPAC